MDPSINQDGSGTSESSGAYTADFYNGINSLYPTLPDQSYNIGFDDTAFHNPQHSQNSYPPPNSPWQQNPLQTSIAPELSHFGFQDNFHDHQFPQRKPSFDTHGMSQSVNPTYNTYPYQTSMTYGSANGPTRSDLNTSGAARSQSQVGQTSTISPNALQTPFLHYNQISGIHPDLQVLFVTTIWS